MSIPIHRLNEIDPLKVDRQIENNEASIQHYQEKIHELAKENDRLRLILDPPTNKKRKLRELDHEENQILEEAKVLKQKRTELENTIKPKIEILDQEMKNLQSRLNYLDHQQCKILFDHHTYQDVTNTYGIVRYQMCTRCGHQTR